MLTAITEDGRRICLADFAKDSQSLRALKQTMTFFCPGCKEKMILKIGTKKITHFAHFRVSSCSEHFEKESAYHLAGKQKLYLWLRDQGLKPELEVFDHNIRQRPDIRFTYQNVCFALEFQCSVIPDELFKKRTRSYLENGYVPLWILGGNFVSRKGNSVSSLSDFQYLCMTAHHQQASITYFCPNSNQFIFIQKIFPISTRNALTTLACEPLTTITIDRFLHPLLNKPPNLQTWQKEIGSFKQLFSQNPQSYRDPFLKMLYSHHLHLIYLPPEVGLPVANSIFIRTPPAVWQGFLYLDCFLKRNPGETISISSIYQAFQKRVNQKQILLRELPLLTGNATRAINEYLFLLERCGYLTAWDETIYQINRQLKVARNMMEQEQALRDFYQRHQTIFQ
ncbi:competence protein CoiA [Bacillus sp. DNRA2]|uniref:competence protein CoiA n=1 Tax=Bacillus sp. DNRA2 TaxID=2723053 RepID=UPI00145E7843|nr:competence protein CoiA family protein [Bacillus sp. DNRA2]NMD71516.1 competence protein CoiA [Bacillus sp. DNRA2]